MKRFIILAAVLLCAVAANAQQLKTAQGITIETEPEPKPKKTLSPTERGFEQSVEVGGHLCLDYISDFLVSAEYIAGYRFNNYLFLGGGTGLELLLNYNSLAMPIYANARLYLLPKSRWQPFVSLSLGALVRIAEGDNLSYDDIQPHINPSIGVNYRINSKYSCYLNLGYMGRRADYTGYQCLTIRLGFTF